MYDQLRRDHLELTHLASELLRRTSTAQLVDAGGLGRCRWQLARTLTRHLALEDAHVYARLDADPHPGVTAIARRYKNELRHLSDQFNDHMAEWSGDAIARDWAGYRSAVKVLLAALKARVECEDNELYPLITPKERAAA
jgi:hypothetical protein